MRGLAVMMVGALGCGRGGFEPVTPDSGVPADAGAAVDTPTAVDASAGYATPTAVQTMSVTGSVAPIAIPLSMPTRAGDLLVVGVAGYCGATAITDDAASGSDVYVSAGVAEQDANSNYASIWYAKAIDAGAMTITIQTCSNDFTVWAAEFSGVDPDQPLAAGTVDKSDVTTAMATAAPVTVTIPGSIVFSTSASGGMELVAGSPFVDLGGGNGNEAVFELAPIGQAAAVWDSAGASDWAISTAMFVPAAL